MTQPPETHDFLLHVHVCRQALIVYIRVTQSEIKSHEFEDIYSLMYILN